MSRLLVCALLAGWGCSEVAGGGPDAGHDYCDMQMSFAPSAPEEGTAVVVEGSIVEVGLVGPRTFSWHVSLGGQTIPHQSRALDDHAIDFLPVTPGVYRVELGGSVDGVDCTGTAVEIPVSASNANTAMYRLRLIPASQTLPVQEKIVSIKGGSGAWPLGDLSLESGLDAGGQVSHSTLGPLSAYVRATKIGEEGFPASETFADASGQFSLRLMSGTYDVLVVPDDNDAAPDRFAGVSPAVIASGLTVEPGSSVSGTVLDSSGLPLAGAQVSLRVGEIPSTIATSDAGGGFALEVRPGPLASLSVVSGVPGNPRLELAPTAILDGTPVTVQLADIAARNVSATVTFADGTTPAPDARVTFVARAIAGAGTVTVSSGSYPATGTARVTVVAGSSGEVDAVLPEAVYDVIAIPPADAPGGEAPSLTSIDLTGANPAPPVISLASTALVTGKVSGSAAGLAGIRITAVPRGLLTNLAPTVITTTSDTGEYALELVGGGSYEVTLEATDQSHGTGVLVLTAPDVGTMLIDQNVALPPAIAVTGTLSVPGAGPATGVTALLYCYECSGAAAGKPIAVGVTDSTGSFRLAVPDPGVGETP